MARFTMLGTAAARPGTVQYGRWEMFHHPTGHVEFLPVIIAQGEEDGPCLWLTAGIHGPEHGGPVVIYKLITETLARQMKGTLVAIPALNPAGLRTKKRQPYHAPKDPNRLWPDGRVRRGPDPDRQPPSSLETAYERLFAEILSSADYMVDFHNAWTGSLSFAFRDRVLYRAGEQAEQSRLEAEALSARQMEMLQAYGHTIVNEVPAETLIDEELHRSTSASALYLARIPAITVELGTGEVPEPAIVAAAVAGTRNIMRWAGMLDGEMEPVTGIKTLDLGYPVRRRSTPRVEEACIVLHLVEPGDVVRAGDPIAEIRDVWGRPVGEGVLRAEQDGFVIGREHGIYYYPGEAVLVMAVRNESPMVFPYPDDFFDKPA